MPKLFLSVRITENFFTSEEINKIENELQSYNNKSDFLRKIIKIYLKLEKDSLLVNDSNYNLNHYNNELKELKNLIKENHKILQQLNLKELQLEPTNYKKTYKGEDQEIKTEKILGLLNQF
jgi:hypothetical protein